MIFEVILNAIQAILFLALGFINIPQFPADFVNGINNIFDLIFDNLSMVSLFLPWSIITVGIPLLLVIINLDKLYSALMWILRKIPMIGMN